MTAISDLFHAGWLNEAQAAYERWPGLLSWSGRRESNPRDQFGRSLDDGNWVIATKVYLDR
jgi:hypothetical protein